MPFFLLLVAAVSFVLDVVFAIRGFGRRWFWVSCAVLMLTGFACWTVLMDIGTTLDSSGVVHEPFVLIPMGWLFVGASVCGTLGCLLVKTLKAGAAFAAEHGVVNKP